MSCKTFIKKHLLEIIAWRNIIQDIRSRYIIPRKRNKYKTCSESAILEMPFDISCYSRISIAPYTKIRKGFTFLGDKGSFTLKKYSTIAMNCIVIPDGHIPTLKVPQIISGSNHINDKISDIIVNEGVWIGINSILLPGTIIGRGSIIGAGSMVNKEIPPYAVAVGSPAKIIASTFSIDEIIEHEIALYPPEERFTRQELEEIFSKYYEGKKSIGHNSIPAEQKSFVETKLQQMRKDIESKKE